MKFVNCPECGHRLIKCDEGSNVQLKCGNCEAIVNAVIKRYEVNIRIEGKSAAQKSNCV